MLSISATDWLEDSLPNEPSWTLQDTVKLSGILAAHGVDLLDVSSAGLHPAQRIVLGSDTLKAYQAPLSEAVKKAHGIDTPTGLLVGSVGGITTGSLAEDILQRGMSDVVFVGRQFQKEPGTVLAFAEQLGVRIKIANQIEWGLHLGTGGRGRKAPLESKQ